MEMKDLLYEYFTETMHLEFFYYFENKGRM